MARKKKTSGVKVNFKGVESRSTPPEGDYKCEVLEAKLTKSDSSGNDMIEFVCEVSEGKHKGTKLWFYATLDEKSLWKLHAFLTALGEEVPDDEMDIDLSELVGAQFVGVLTHETYKGKKRAKLTDFDTIDNWEGGDEDDGDEDGDDKPKKDKGKAKKAKSKDDGDDGDDDDDDEPKKKGKSKKSKKSDDDDDDEPKGKKSKKKSKKKAKKIAADDVDDMDEDELQDLIDEHDLDVDLDDHKKLKKKIAAVKEALDEADLLDDD